MDVIHPEARGGMREWLRRNVRFLAIVLGIACLLEVTFDSLEGTKHNFEFPWGHYRATLAVFAVLLLIVGYLTRPRNSRTQPDEPSADRTTRSE